MKLKQSPDDFRVEELTDVSPTQGDFAFYRLDKVGWNTADALAAIRRIWRIQWQQLEYGGLKDRHANTTQYLSIDRGPMRDLSEKGWSLKYLGQIARPYTSLDIRANRFRVVVRNLHPWQMTRAEAAANDVRSVGVPNYFDDQRFGSVNTDRKFVAKEMVLGRFEDALKLALAGVYEFDRAKEKQEKKILLDHWGRWPECKAALPRGHIRSIVDYLVHHPSDFRGACARLKPELRGLYLSVYQSDLWNRMLSRWLTSHLTSADLTGVKLRLGIFAVPKLMPAELLTRWQEGQLPLPSARLKPEESASWQPLVNDVLKVDDLTLEQMKIKGLDKPFFSKGDRAMCLKPDGFVLQAIDDDRHKQRKAMIAEFELPRGCYATMIIKRLTATQPLKV